MDLKVLFNQNSYWEDSKNINKDPKLIEFDNAKVKWYPDLLVEFDLKCDLIYTLRGPRQVGKTTLIKILIRKLLNTGINPQRIFYFSCDLITGERELLDLIQTFLDWARAQTKERLFIFLDEISSVVNWQKAIKYLVDLGRLSNCTLILTGSHSMDIRKNSERLPGRRGKASDLDKTLRPMSFREYLSTLRDNGLIEDIKFPKFSVEDILKGKISLSDLRISNLSLYSFYFKNYALTGGFPLSIEVFYKEGKIPDYVYSIYLQWVIGDITRFGKKEKILNQIVERLIRSLSSPISWQTITKETEIGSHHTVLEYIDILVAAYILNVLYHFDIGRGYPSYKKNKKVYFRDPLLLYAFSSLAFRRHDSFEIAREWADLPEKFSRVVEGIVVEDIRRRFGEDVFYWQNKGEIDILIKRGSFPIEIKYRSKINRRDLKGILKTFKKGLILSKDLFDIIERNFVILPIPVFLLGE